MGVDIFIFEIGVEFVGDLYRALVGGGEDGGEGDLVFGGDGFVGEALFGETFGANYRCSGIGGVPGGEEDVVLDVGGYYVGDIAAEGFYGFLDSGG
jgi:hypothetical protein